MANRSDISEFKSKIIQSIALDNTIFQAFNAKDCTDGTALIGTHIFGHNKNPTSMTEAGTYMTVTVHTTVSETNNAFIIITVEICIYSHSDHMQMDSTVTSANRHDYMARRLEELLDNSSDYGAVSRLRLVNRTEGIDHEIYPYCRLQFETLDMNPSFCE